MVERYKRGKGKKNLLGSHQKCWIWGRNLVLETLAAGRWPIVELFLSEALPDEARSSACSRAADLGVPADIVPSATLENMGHTAEHQGYLARMSLFPYAPLESLIAGPTPGGDSPFLVMADGLQDPFNLGAVIRSAEVFGAGGVIIRASGQTGVTSMVARSSAGAVNRIPIARVESLESAADILAARGIALVGASEKAEAELDAFDFRRPVCIAVGNEGFGLSQVVQDKCTSRVRIPQQGCVGSLNAAVAAGVFFYELRRQRRQPA
jgi:23S rRNA (guanosine2251-2'-O)-methyltransferase